MANREERLAKNEVLFREVNERVRSLEGEAGDGEEIGFVCECGREECIERIRLTVREYERVRSVATQFAIARGHETAAVERVVDETDRYAVIVKAEEEAQIAIDTDPRRRE